MRSLLLEEEIQRCRHRFRPKPWQKWSNHQHINLRDPQKSMRHLINFREVAVDNYSHGPGQKVPYECTPEDGTAKLWLSIRHNPVTAEAFGQVSFLGDCAGLQSHTRAYTPGAPRPLLLIHRYEVQIQNAINSVPDKIASCPKNMQMRYRRPPQ